MTDLSARHIRYLRSALSRARQRAIEELELDEGDVSAILIAHGYDDRELALLEQRAVEAERESRSEKLSRQQSQHERWIEEGLSDLSRNVLWVLYSEQAALDSQAPTYAVYSLYIAIRAIVRMMTNVPDGRKKLARVVGEDRLPAQQSVQEFAALAAQIHEPFRYIQAASLGVPGILQAASSLLRLYEASVDWVSWKPHNQLSQAFANVFLPPDERVPLDYGVMLYTTKRYSLQRISEMTRIPRRLLAERLRASGQMRYPGRPGREIQVRKEIPYRDDLASGGGSDH